MDVKNLGQVFTPQKIVEKMLSLRKNNGRTLEPSCGNGAFSNLIKECVAIEYDKRVAPSYAKVMDFFDYSIEEKFDTIIGNPPYVRFQDINTETKEKLDMSLFDERSNLYLFFIHKCVKHLNDKGELIFIVPRELLKATSACKLNGFLLENGTITDIIDLGDQPIFKNACPNTIIFRYEKGNLLHQTNDGRNFKVLNGQIVFTQQSYIVPFNKLFFVKVGAVSGADKYFESKEGNLDFVCSKTNKTGETKKMFYETYDKSLEQHKEQLIKRKIKNFTEENWWSWGRKYFVSDKERIYVNQKTRNEKPFFYNECKAYDGSVLAIFPKFDISVEEIKKIIGELNSVNWIELGFVCDGRYIFSQRTLENIMLPNTFAKYLDEEKCPRFFIQKRASTFPQILLCQMHGY